MVTREGRVGHTVRDRSGRWQTFGDVKQQTGDVGPVARAAAGVVQGDLHVAVVTIDGGLYHTIRAGNGSWQPFGDVQSQTGRRGPFSLVSIG